MRGRAGRYFARRTTSHASGLADIAFRLLRFMRPTASRIARVAERNAQIRQRLPDGVLLRQVPHFYLQRITALGSAGVRRNQWARMPLAPGYEPGNTIRQRGAQRAT